MTAVSDSLTWQTWREEAGETERQRQRPAIIFAAGIQYLISRKRMERHWGALPASSGCPARRTSSSPGGESLMLLPGPDFRSAGVGRARLVDSRRWHKEILLAAKMKKIDEVENVGSLRQYNQVMNRSLQRDLRPKFGHSALSHHP